MSGEVAFFVGRVAHVEGVIPFHAAVGCTTGGVGDDVVAAFRLVDVDLAGGADVVEVLLGVYAGVLRGGPAGCVDGCGAGGGFGGVCPVD